MWPGRRTGPRSEVWIGGIGGLLDRRGCLDCKSGTDCGFGTVGGVGVGEVLVGPALTLLETVP